MKLRVGACALMLVLAGCSGESTESGVAGMRDVAASKVTGSLPVSLPLARAIGNSIANAPDRGALLSYADNAEPAMREGAYTWYPTAISEAHAVKGIVDGEMSVPSPDGSQVKLRYERHVEEVDGNWTWIGRVIGGDPMQEAIITFGEKAVFGSIPQANGKPALQLETRNGSLFAVQTDPSKVVSATKGHADMMIPEAAALRSSMAAAVAQSVPVTQGAAAIAQAAPPSGANTIDVAIGYTPGFAAANNGASGAATRLVFLVQVGNQAFANSGINGYLRIVHAMQVDYTNTNTNQTALQELTGSTGNSPVTIPAGLAPLRAARDQYGADIALLVRNFNTPEHQGCGIAWLNGASGPSNPSQPPITAADAAWGYAVISDGFDKGSDGKEYFCAYETLVHEAAHLMGSAHDRANSRDSSGNLQYGAYSYSFGYKTAAAAGNFYTVMAYGDVGQTAHRIFSTPLKSTCGGTGNLACGVANSEDNARSLNLTLPVVAEFRDTVVPFDKRPRNDINGDGRSDLLLRSTTAATNNVTYWLMNGATKSSEKSFTWSLSYNAASVGDFNGDGRADILWIQNGTRLVRMWIARADGTYVTHTLSNHDDGWFVAGTADVNADGNADVIWRHRTAATNNVKIWYMNGPTVVSEALFTWSLSYELAATGDFNGDGRADIVWVQPATGLVRLWRARAGGDFAAANIGNYTGAWSIVAAGDINGDGKDDLFWRHRTNAADNVMYWLMNDTTITRQTMFTWSQSYKVEASGDYNGDGLLDIAWVQSGTGLVRLWLARSSGAYPSANVGNLPSSFFVVDPESD